MKISDKDFNQFNFLWLVHILATT